MKAARVLLKCEGPGYRVYFGKDGERLVILLIAGTKKTQRQDIETAKRFWRDYHA